MRRLVLVTSAVLAVATVGWAPPPTDVGTAPDSALGATADVFNEFTAVDGTARDDVWVVGLRGGSGLYTTVTKHWDGKAWTTVASPSPRGTAVLTDVAVVATDDVWAVGDAGIDTYNLVLHWDGTSWSEVDVPQPPGQYNHLRQVDAIAADQVIASGVWCRTGEGPCYNQTLVWDGEVWTWEQSGRVASVQIADAISPDDAWGAGTAAYGDDEPVIQRWDGSRWRPVRVPDTTSGARLNALSTVSEDDAWAAGAVLDAQGYADGGWLLHWDGSAWSESDAGSPALESITDVDAVSSREAWLVGARDLGTATRHWDGSSWEDVRNPLDDKGTLVDVKTFTRRHAWAVGWVQDDTTVKQVLLRWNGKRWTRYAAR